MTLERRLGPEAAAVIDDLVGEGLSLSLAGDRGALAGLTQAVAGGWSVAVDRPFRRASFLHEARKAGYRTPSEIRRLLDDADLADDLSSVTIRANQEIIDFAGMTPIERNLIRRIVFVYPWIRGATRYAGTLLAEHPVQSAVYAQLGRQGQEFSEETLGPLPSFLEGSFGVGGRLVNPASVSPLGTPVEVGRALAGLATGDPRTGFPLRGNALEVARDLTVAGWPQAAIVNKLAPDSSLVRALTGGRGSRLYEDSTRDVLARYGVGGLYPRRYDPARLRQLYEQERRGR